MLRKPRFLFSTMNQFKFCIIAKTKRTSQKNSYINIVYIITKVFSCDSTAGDMLDILKIVSYYIVSEFATGVVKGCFNSETEWSETGQRTVFSLSYILYSIDKLSWWKCSIQSLPLSKQFGLYTSVCMSVCKAGEKKTSSIFTKYTPCICKLGMDAHEGSLKSFEKLPSSGQIPPIH